MYLSLKVLVEDGRYYSREAKVEEVHWVFHPLKAKVGVVRSGFPP